MMQPPARRARAPALSGPVDPAHGGAPPDAAAPPAPAPARRASPGAMIVAARPGGGAPFAVPAPGSPPDHNASAVRRMLAALPRVDTGAPRRRVVLLGLASGLDGIEDALDVEEERAARTATTLVSARVRHVIAQADVFAEIILTASKEQGATPGGQPRACAELQELIGTDSISGAMTATGYALSLAMAWRECVLVSALVCLASALFWRARALARFPSRQERASSPRAPPPTPRPSALDSSPHPRRVPSQPPPPHAPFLLPDRQTPPPSHPRSARASWPSSPRDSSTCPTCAKSPAASSASACALRAAAI